MKILTVNDLSGSGNCSLVAHIAVLSAYGYETLPLPSAVFSLQTGFDNFHHLPNSELWNFYKDIAKENKTIDAVTVGFLANEAQLEELKAVVTEQKANGAFVLVDPVMADWGELYVLYDDSYVQKMKGLVALADVITPNLTEACLLCDVDYLDAFQDLNCLADMYSLCEKLSDITRYCDKAVVTSVPLKDKFYNVVYDCGECRLVSNDRVGVDFSGCGDLFSAVLICELMQKKPLYKCVEKASAFVCRCAKESSNRNERFGVDFFPYLSELKKRK